MELWNNLCAQKLLSTLPFKVKYSIKTCPYIKRKKHNPQIFKNENLTCMIYNTLVVDMSSIDWLCGIQINMTLFIYLFIYLCCFATLVNLLKRNFTNYLIIFRSLGLMNLGKFIFKNQKIKVIWFVESRLMKGIFIFLCLWDELRSLMEWVGVNSSWNMGWIFANQLLISSPIKATYVYVNTEFSHG